jgi:hypothetical protein
MALVLCRMETLGLIAEHGNGREYVMGKVANAVVAAGMIASVAASTVAPNSTPASTQTNTGTATSQGTGSKGGQNIASSSGKK